MEMEKLIFQNLSCVCLSWMEKMLRTNLQKYSDGDGKITINELRTVLSSVRELVDTNIDEEMPDVEAIFKDMDKDGDNQITQEEFVQAGMKDELFINWLIKLF
eukprot:TRINITY_DN4942_c0_g2_i13.p2 TRINITY_DN4942_c0_g2~~TRINITY_DN4942_c0_g2_i13.p2  ORF type:complete len:103 (+),score=25.47 TRINITY_DN4942_c0_g2_i13:607-915(+)